jgi:hypothetical protein
MATNLTEIRNFLNEPYNDLGVNAWIFADLVKTYKNARFMDLGVRLGASSAIMSINADDNNNQVCGCDLKFEGFERTGARFVQPNYMCYMADSVFHDTHSIAHSGEDNVIDEYTYGDTIGGVKVKRPDVAITDFFGLSESIRDRTEYEDDNIKIEHYKPSHGMTFVQIKNLDAIKEYKKNIDWEHVFETRNWLNDLHFNTENPKFVDWQQDIPNIQNELVITP